MSQNNRYQEGKVFMKLKMTCAVLAALMTTQASAASFNADGKATGTSKTQVIEIAADHMILDSRTEYASFEMVDTTNPMSQLKGECFGVIEVRGGAAEGGGVCVLDGLAGDQVLLGWTARRLDPRGSIHGYWTVNSGKGTWQQASGGGTFSSRTNPSNGTSENTIKGAITLR